MKIEVLDLKDLAAYKALMDDCFGGSNPLERYQQYANRAGYTIWAAKDGERIVGSVTTYAIDLFTFDFQPCLMLFNVAVLGAYRKQGIGRRLLELVIDKARKDGFRSISLTCLDDAYPAHRLYESVGFKRASSLKYDLKL
ncbi:GNAT family N-acetyltransferase [Gehongia tenuis]|jgi:ribosomal protein S18 acetylase RimI-like enzyme|uniref:GNAT family N-acetyltransferase n=1 Tax=Gehongia tenuis TaxID=2763655 RepID=A0A926D3F5_9FIRM|nr:GNAT family N-acetyltransferase [Gehongia tenuis]MBC8530836.1 GNAT family N-acetyltransferase [Gehongia tenuis]